MQSPLLPLDVGPVLRDLDIVGLAVFAASGALTAAQRRLDVIAAGFPWSPRPAAGPCATS